MFSQLYLNYTEILQVDINMKLQKVIKYYGNKSNIAKALGLHRSAITNWGDAIPQFRQYQIQILTNGKLKAS